MRSFRDPAKAPVYEAARRFVEVALRHDGSLFEPDRSVWSAWVLDDLHIRFNLAPDESSDRFEEKFQRQLVGAPTATIQLAAEVVFVHFLIARDIGGSAKRHLIDLIRSWSHEPISIPHDLDAVLDLGICNTGVAFKTYRPNQLWFLIDAIRAWKELPGAKREQLLREPWEFKDFIEVIPQKAAYTQRQALIHLVFPETFEDMVSRDHKALIVQAFKPEVPAPLPQDPDRALAIIRKQLTPEFGEDFAFYASPLVERWRPTQSGANTTQEAATEGRSRRAWLTRGTEDGQSVVPDWLSSGYCSIGWNELGEVPINIDRPTLLERLHTAYPDASDGTIRNYQGVIAKFLQTMRPNDVVLAPNGQDLYVGIVDGDVEYRAAAALHKWRRPVEWANASEPISRSSVSPSLYSKLRTLLTITDVTENLTELEAYLAPTPGLPPAHGPAGRPEVDLSPADLDLARSLHVPVSWLDAQIELLQRKQQLVFYGPPGTGKTYLAQALADYLTRDGGAFQLVQFHPSYSYEDFFEGFRPRSTGAGTIGFELVPGPLRRLADAARSDRGRPYILIIDEMNRANLAKVFGELYFLLEYRDRAIALQYSADELFELPRNLFVLGTMNTVDRSIALVDAAMRRRFYFTALFPDRPPINATLRSWLRGTRPDRRDSGPLGCTEPTDRRPRSHDRTVVLHAGRHRRGANPPDRMGTRDPPSARRTSLRRRRRRRLPLRPRRDPQIAYPDHRY